MPHTYHERPSWRVQHAPSGMHYAPLVPGAVVFPNRGEALRCVSRRVPRARFRQTKGELMANVAVVLSDDFEDSEFRVPYDRLKAAGHNLTIIGKKAGETVKGKKGKESVKVEASGSDRNAIDFAGLLIPGGYSPDHLRTDQAIVDLVK